MCDKYSEKGIKLSYSYKNCLYRQSYVSIRHCFWGHFVSLGVSLGSLGVLRPPPNLGEFSPPICLCLGAILFSETQFWGSFICTQIWGGKSQFGGKNRPKLFSETHPRLITLILLQMHSSGLISDKASAWITDNIIRLGVVWGAYFIA